MTNLFARGWPLPLLVVLSLACATLPPLPPLGQIGVGDLQLAPVATTLPDGLRLVHERMPDSGAVALVLTLRAGATRDPAGRAGLAHLVEHLTFRARDDRGRTLRDRYEELGVTQFNAFTDHESTIYVAVVPRASLAAALALEAERLRAPLQGINDEDVAIERDIVGNEILERNERDFEGGLMAWAAQALFPSDHRYRKPIGGNIESLAAIGRRDALWFTATQYRPTNATLTVVGDVERSEIDAALARVRSGEAPPTGADPLPDLVDVPLAPPDPPAGGIAQQEGSFAGPRIWLAWTLPGTYGPTSAFTEVLPRVLNGLIDTQQLAGHGPTGADIGRLRFFVAPGLAASTLFAEAHLRSGRDPQGSAKIVIDAVAKLGQPEPGGDAEAVMAHVVMGVLSQVVLETEDMLTRATRYAEADRVTGDAVNALARMRRVVALDHDTLASFCGAYLTPARARIAVVSARKAGTRTTAAVARATAAADAATSEGGAAAEQPVAALPSPQSARRIRLPNGLDVILWPRPGFPAVSAALVFPGGQSVANPPGAEVFLQDGLPLRYCGGHPTARGIVVDTTVQPDGIIETAHGGAENLSAVLLSLAERAAAYQFDGWGVLQTLHRRECAHLSPDEERTRLWKRTLEDGQRRLEQRRLASAGSAHNQAVRAVARALWKDTGYQLPTADQIAQVTAEGLNAWYGSSRRPDHAVLIVAGQLDPVAGETLVRDWFSSWKPSPATAAPRPLQKPAPPSAARPTPLVQIEEAGATQARVVLGCRLGSTTSTEGAAARVMAQLLSRDLRLRLREQMGTTYGVNGDLFELKAGATMMMMETDVARDRLAPVMQEAIARLDALATAPPAPALLRQARLAVLREMGGPASSAQLVRLAARLTVLGQPLDRLDDTPRDAARVTGPAVQAAAVACRRTLTLAAAADADALATLNGALPGVVKGEAP
jgi:zinc protease